MNCIAHPGLSPAIASVMACCVYESDKDIASTTHPLICEGDKTTCFASVETRLTAAEAALTSARARTDGLGLEVHRDATGPDPWLGVIQAFLTLEEQRV